MSRNYRWCELRLTLWRGRDAMLWRDLGCRDRGYRLVLNFTPTRCRVGVIHSADEPHDYPPGNPRATELFPPQPFHALLKQSERGRPWLLLDCLAESCRLAPTAEAVAELTAAMHSSPFGPSPLEPAFFAAYQLMKTARQLGVPPHLLGRFGAPPA